MAASSASSTSCHGNLGLVFPDAVLRLLNTTVISHGGAKMGSRTQVTVASEARTSPFKGGMDIVAAQKWAYIDNVPDNIAQFTELLCSYGQIDPRKAQAHLLHIRQKAWDISRFPCFGRWKFLDLLSSQEARYQQVLFRLTLQDTRDAFLDLGCCVGQALRQLRHDGVPGSRLYGFDKDSRFINLGYDLFQDKKKLKATFVVGDILASSGLEPLRGQITIVHATSFFHLFDWKQQLQIGKALVELLKPGTKNGLVYGRQAGVETRGRELPGIGGATFLHDKESFQQLWNEIGALTKTAWVVDMNISPPSVEADHDSALPGLKVDVKAMDFTIHQVK